MNHLPHPPPYVVSQSSQPKKRSRQTTFPFASAPKRYKQEEPYSQPTGDWPPTQSQSQPIFSQFSQNTFRAKEEHNIPAPKIPATLPLENRPNLVVAVVNEILGAKRNHQGGVDITKEPSQIINAHLFEILGNIISIEAQPPSGGLIKFKITDESSPHQPLPVEFFPETNTPPNILVGGAYRIIGRAAVETRGVVFQCMGIFECMDREEREFIREIGRRG